MLSRILVSCFLAWALASAPRAETVGNIGEGTKLFTILKDGAKAVDAEVVFWRGEWSWIDLRADLAADAAADRYRFRADAAEEKFTIEGNVHVSSDGKPNTWALRFMEDPLAAKDVFGAIVFKTSLENLQRDGFQPRPEVLPGNLGFSLQMAPDEPPLTVTFDKPVAAVEFEAGSPGELRAYVLQRDDVAQLVDVTMTVAFDGKFAASAEQRRAKPDETWWSNDIHWMRSPVDLSFLNAPEAPAGKRGFLRSQGENLVFEDGTVARFWGTNLSAYGIFGVLNPEAARTQAKRLSKLGFNLVRIHHHDSDWVDPNIFGKNPKSTRTLDAHALAGLDWWIKCLKDEGIYVWLDLHVGRELTALDGVDDFDEIAKGTPPRATMQGYLYVNESMEARSKEFADAYLNHVNAHTGLAYKDDPAVVAVLVTNENDLTRHFGNVLLPDKNVPKHSDRYMGLSRQFADTHGFDAEAVWRSWEFGPSKLFLADLQHRYVSRMRAHLRALGVKVPIVGTSYWDQMGAVDLLELAAGDLIDAHSYGRANEIERNPRIEPNIASWISGGAVAGKPLTVSEWNVEPFPVFDRYQFAPYLAAVASLQSWNAMLQYAYTQAPLHGWAPVGNWEAISDPAMLSLMPAAALLYRQGHVRPSLHSYELAIGADALLSGEINARTSRAIRTLTETSKLRIRLPVLPALAWLPASPDDPGAKQISDLQFDATNGAQEKICADTGEFCRDWKAGVLTLDTERSQMASGWLGGQNIALKDVKLALSTPNAAIAVQSLDDAPIRDSARIMISMSAQAEPLVKDRLPFFSEPIVGTLEVRARSGLMAYAADQAGQLRAVPFETTADGYRLPLSGDIKSNWIFLQ